MSGSLTDLRVVFRVYLRAIVYIASSRGTKPSDFLLAARFSARSWNPAPEDTDLTGHPFGPTRGSNVFPCERDWLYLQTECQCCLLTSRRVAKVPASLLLAIFLPMSLLAVLVCVPFALDQDGRNGAVSSRYVSPIELSIGSPLVPENYLQPQFSDYSFVIRKNITNRKNSASGYMYAGRLARRNLPHMRIYTC